MMNAKNIISQHFFGTSVTEYQTGGALKWD